MTYRNTITTRANKNEMLWQISPYKSTGLPTNSIFYKGRCGIGGTTMELMHKRHSIIVVPTVASISGKSDRYNEILGVMGEEGINKEEKIKRIMKKLQSTNRFIKIMTTPDSFECIIIAAQKLNKVDWLKENVFLLLDESHSFVTEAFRKNITIPFKHFWNFNNRCLISATPFEFSDPAFEKLDKHEIIITEKLNVIELVETMNIEGAIHFLLTHPEKFPANVHIFYNSISQLSARVKLAIMEMGEISCNIYCSKSDENLKKLGEISKFFKEEPKDADYKKFNFYTSRYFEAWDLKDDNATIILITDVSAPHTKVGITNKGVQAIGRLRSNPNRILHFTNHSNKIAKKGIQHIKLKHQLYAKDTINAFNIHADNCKKVNIIPYPQLADGVLNYGTIANLYKAELEIIKIDQWVNHDVCNEEYNNMGFIKEAWESSNYDIVLKKVRNSSVPNVKNLKVEEQLRTAFKMVEELESNKHNMLFSDDYSEESKNIQSIGASFELAFKAFYVLGMDCVNTIGFDKKRIKIALSAKMEEQMIHQISEEIKVQFLLDRYYSNKEGKLILQNIYASLDYKNTNGTRKSATTTHLEENYGCSVGRNKAGFTITHFKKLK